MRRLMLTLMLLGVAAGTLIAGPLATLRLGGSLGVPGVLGADAEVVLPGALAGRFRIAPVVQASFLPITLVFEDAEAVFYATGTLALRAYFRETADRWYVVSGVSTILIHSDKWERAQPLYGRAYAISIPIGIGWRGVWGSFTQAIEIGGDLPISLEAVFARAYDGTAAGSLVYVSRIPVIGFVPRVHLTLGWNRERR